jgi:hypothetical protein
MGKYVCIPHILGSPTSHITVQLLQALNFLIYEGNLIFFFISVELTILMPGRFSLSEYQAVRSVPCQVFATVYTHHCGLAHICISPVTLQWVPGSILLASEKL